MELCSRCYGTLDRRGPTSLNNPNIEIGAALLAEAMDDIDHVYKLPACKPYQDLIHQRLSEYRRSSGTVGDYGTGTSPTTMCASCRSWINQRETVITLKGTAARPAQRRNVRAACSLWAGRPGRAACLSAQSICVSPGHAAYLRERPTLRLLRGRVAQQHRAWASR